MNVDEDTAKQPALEDDPYEFEFEPEPPPVRARRRFGRATVGLLAAVVAAAGFFAGVEVQKHQGSGTQVTAAGASATGGRTGGRTGGQGRGAFGGGAAAALGGSGGGGGGGGGGTPEVGQVQTIDGSTLYVTDFQGNTVKITTSPASRVTKSQQLTVNDVRPGDTVVVRGTQQPDGSYTADSVTVGGASGGASGG